MYVTISYKIHKYVEFEEPRKVFHLEFTVICGNKKIFGVSKKRGNLFPTRRKFRGYGDCHRNYWYAVGKHLHGKEVGS